MATIVAATGAAGNWTDGSAWVGGTAPTAADDAQITTLTTSITINSGAVCRSADFTGCTGTVTHNAGATLTIGDATAGLGNIALKLVAGLTAYTLNNATTSAISFVSTSTTQQTIDWGGKTHGNLTFNGSGGSWIFNDASTGVGTVTTLTAGTFNTNGQTCSWGLFASSGSLTRTLTPGASAINLSGTTANTTWDTNVVTNLTITANTATITLSGAGGGMRTSGVSGFSGTSVVMSGSGTQNLSLSSALTIANFTRTGTAVKTDVFGLSTSNLTVTGTLRLDGNSVTNRLLVQSTALGTARTITAATMSASTDNVDFKDITAAGAANWDLSAKSTGDCGGNSVMTLTTAQTQYWVGGTGSWSTAAEWGTTSGGSGGRTPLPQDDTIFDANSFSAPAQDSFLDMPRCGKTLTCTTAVGANEPRLYNSNTIEMYGGYDLSGAADTSFGNGFNLTFAGRGSFNFIQGSYTGMGGSATTTIAAPGGVYTLQDAMSMLTSGARSFAVSHGTFDANGYNVTFNIYNGNFTTTKTITMGGGTWTVFGSGSSMWLINATGTTLNRGTSTILSTGTSAKTFTGGGLTYNDLTFSGTGTATITIAGSNTFNRFRDIGTGAHTLTFTSLTTQTVGSFNVVGSSGNVISLSKSGIAAATLTDSSGVNCCDWIAITGINAEGGASWYTGRNSTGGTDSGWIGKSCGDSGIVNNPVALGGF